MNEFYPLMNDMATAFNNGNAAAFGKDGGQIFQDIYDKMKGMPVPG